MNDQPVHEIHTQTNEWVYIYIRAHSELRENTQHRKQHIKQNKHSHPLGPSWSRHPVQQIHMDDTRQIQAPTYTIPQWVVVFHCRMKAAGWRQCEMPRGKVKLQINNQPDILQVQHKYKYKDKNKLNKLNDTHTNTSTTWTTNPIHEIQQKRWRKR